MLSSSSGSSESEVAVRLAALEELDAWYEQNCIDSEPVRHVAPPAPPLGWLVCDNDWATTAFQGPVGPVYPGATVIYGDSSLAEPFAGPTVSVLSGIKLWPQEETGISVTVNGAEAVAGPAQLFQFITNPDLGHVVTWTAGGIDLALFGRGYSAQQMPELLALAETVSVVDDIGILTRPNLDLLYNGTTEPLISLMPMSAPGRTFELLYTESGGSAQNQPMQVQIEGLRLTAEQFAASRTFFVDYQAREFHGQPGYVATVWHDGGPVVAAWRYDDDTVIRVTNLGGQQPLETHRLVVEAAEASIELDSEAWLQASSPSPDC